MRGYVGFALALAACSAPHPRANVGTQCELNSECAAPLVCRLGYCRRECATHVDCFAPSRCVLDADRLGACLLPEETRCALQTDCPSPLVCRSTQCVNECAADRDCAGGTRCDLAEHACVPHDRGSCTLHGECPGDLICGPDRLCDEECHSDRDCRNGTVCRDPERDGYSACLVDCGAGGSCLPSEVCTPDGVCRPACASDAGCTRLETACDRTSGGPGYCRPTLVPRSSDGGMGSDAG